MKIKLTTAMAGADFSYAPDSEVEFDDAVALALVASGQAVMVSGAPPVAVSAKTVEKIASNKRGKVR